MTKPDLITESKRILSEEGSSIKPEFLPELEETFMKLMKLTKYHLLNPRVEKLMKLLATVFSEEITEDWFKNRNKERKKKELKFVLIPSQTKSSSSMNKLSLYVFIISTNRIK